MAKIIEYEGLHYEEHPEEREKHCDGCWFYEDGRYDKYAHRDRCPGRDKSSAVQHDCSGDFIIYKEVDPLYQDLLKAKEMSK